MEEKEEWKKREHTPGKTITQTGSQHSQGSKSSMRYTGRIKYHPALLLKSFKLLVH
jgi:hypothetical protein